MEGSSSSIKVLEQNSKAHPIFAHDPQKWMDFVFKEVQVETNFEFSYRGVIYTVDPVSQSLVLVQLRDMKVVSVQLVPGHAVKRISVTDHEALTDEEKRGIDSFFNPQSQESHSADETKKRREDLFSWFVKNMIPVTMCSTRGERMIVADSLYIDPPYTVDCCQSANAIMLDRIQTLMRRMPQQ